ncbi:probable flap endonuclease 1 homolog isoform X2 [Nothobranchius furzeri]|uniref:Flap endonuclease 1-like protein n=3 Tax=Nothobranchius TaxID=28779 RepID=A0A1A8AX56_NOTFU|nr:probable flap endonuclease 1 homolog isoform X2 [Nothobranchius furzeri]KAF7223441.1 putative flap endonuclease 1-like protein [Nothobranchius furzeri]
MGILKLADLIRSEAPAAVSFRDISDYAGKVIALDTSVVVNQFRAATPTLSPLTGLFFRTLTFLEHGIKPVFVLDGRPPVEKSAVLKRRAEAAGWSNFNPTGTGTRTASTQTRDCVELLKYLGVPVIQAPGDAEAMCARLVANGVVDAVASEDMDTLPFGAKVLIRQLNAKRNSAVVEYSLAKLLEELHISQKELVDLCILLGCDYCDKLRGLGPKRALTLIQTHRTIENVVLNINRETHPVPESWKYQEARNVFLEAPQTQVPELTWMEPDEEALVKILCHLKHHREGRIRHRMKMFRESRESRREKREQQNAAGCHRQTRLGEFFMVTRKRSQAVEVGSSLGANTKRPKAE